jgi:hypothetical protein
MNAITRRVAPDATSQIRADHTHVMAIFHRYRLDGRGRDRRALVDAACLALEVHARLEEEIFYPAMHSADAGEAGDVDEKIADHDRMRALIARLRASSADDPSFDEDFMTLMREVMHHVADEETRMLPLAERTLGAQRLDELGAQMTSRRMALMAPRSGEMVGNAVRAAPGSAAVVVAGTLLGAAWLARRAMNARV